MKFWKLLAIYWLVIAGWQLFVSSSSPRPAGLEVTHDNEADSVAVASPYCSGADYAAPEIPVAARQTAGLEVVEGVLSREGTTGVPSASRGPGEASADVAGPGTEIRRGISSIREPDGIRRGDATFYDVVFAGRKTRSGRTYWPSDPTIAAVADVGGEPVIRLGTVLEVYHAGTGECVVVSALDTGDFPATDLDLSPAVWEKLRVPTSLGRIPIIWREVKE